MAAATQDRNTPFRDVELLAVPVAAGVRIRAGLIVVANATGFALEGSTSAAITYLGRAEASVDNTAGPDGGAIVYVRRSKAFKWANEPSDPVTQASFGKPAYIVDNQTVGKTNGGGTRSLAGTVVGVDADGVWIN
ncbi:hypothetical protein [Chitinimonas sp.]|uniref:hypothetical protein n=1 Tax=Chitinimonas sp. TaxID=1934313 RepID=UPI0035B37E85